MGVETPTRLKNVEGSLDSFTCRWATSDTSSGSFVQVVSAPAGRWAETVAVELRSLPPTGDPRRMRQLRQAASKPLETGADACRFARRLFEISGAQNGAERLVAQTLTSIEKPMVMAQ